MKKQSSSVLLAMCFLVACLNSCANKESVDTTPKAQTQTSTASQTTATTTISTTTAATPASGGTTTASSATPSATPAPATAGATTAQLAATATAPAASASTPAGHASTAIASADGEMTGIRTEVTELKHSSENMLKLKFTVINDSDQEWKTYGVLGTGGDSYGVAGVALIDEAGKKKYFVVRDGAGTALCSQDISAIAPHSRCNYWAQYPAPPAGVQKLSISVPHFEPMSNVPLQ